MPVDLLPPPLEIVYPDSDGEPMAESLAHLDVILALYSLLGSLLADQEAMVFSNQFLYYEKGNPQKRVAPDSMVVLGVKLPDPENYKIWETGIVPQFIAEVISEGTRQEDFQRKKDLYERLGVLEYWLFDPKGEWLKEQLLGYELVNDRYETKGDRHSNVLGITFQVEGRKLRLLDDRTGEPLLNREAAAERQAKEAALEQAAAERQAKERERQAKERERQAKEAALAQLAQLTEQLRQQGIDPDQFL